MQNYFYDLIRSGRSRYAFTVTSTNGVEVIDRTTAEVTEFFELEEVGPQRRPIPRVALSIKKWNPRRFTDQAKVPKAVHRSWNIDESNILNSTTLTGGELGKFSWHPLTGEFIPDDLHGNHASSINNFGSSPFDAYVRGIVLHDRKLVTTRPWMPDRSVTGEDASILAFEGQHSAKEMLQRYGLPSNWDFQYNTSNTLLQEMTQIHRW